MPSQLYSSMPDRGVPPTPAPPEPDADDLADYLRPLWRWRWAIIAMAVVAGAVGWTAAYFRVPVYEATVTLRVTASEGVPRMAEYVVLLRNRALATQVVNELGIDKPPHNMSGAVFASQVGIEEVPGAPLLVVRVRMSDPARAMAAANLLVSRAVEFNRALNQEKTVLLRDLLAAEQAEARKRMDAASDQYLAFQGSAQVDLTRRDVAAVLDQRSGLLGLTVQLQAERARLGKAEEELARHSRYVDAPGRASTTAALLDKAMAGESSATSNAPAPPGPQPLSSTSPATNVRLDQPSQGLPSGLDLSNPLLNPVYQVIDYEVAAGRSRVAGLERQRSELVDRLKLNAPQVKELGDLQQKETRLEELHLEFELARDVYANLSKRYEEARASLGSQSAGLQVIDPALPPAMPMAASAWQTAVVATASGLMLGTILVLVGYAISTRRRSAF